MTSTLICLFYNETNGKFVSVDESFIDLVVATREIDLPVTSDF